MVEKVVTMGCSRTFFSNISAICRATVAEMLDLDSMVELLKSTKSILVQNYLNFKADIEIKERLRNF